MQIDLRLGDCLEVMGEMEKNSIDTVITDPPYGLGEQPDIIELLKAWIKQEKYEAGNSGGFMGKEWDKIVPGPIYWKEVYRVMKPGAMLLAFGGTRTVDLLTIALRIAGFEIRDQIEWVYGSGMNKGGYVALSMERRLTYINDEGNRLYESDDEPMRTKPPFRYPGANKWFGWAPGLKPAHEPILLAMKPIENSFIENAFDYRISGLNIDGGRIPTDEEITNHSRSEESAISKGIYGDSKEQDTQKLGRWPANLILSHDPRCKRIGSKKIKGRQINRWKDGAKPFGGGAGHEYESEDFGMEVVEIYECHPDCPIRIMNEQSGDAGASGPASGPTYKGEYQGNAYGVFGGTDRKPAFHNDNGGAARFFYCAKASKSERNEGMEGTINDHPTVKPLALMKYLCRLTATPDGGVVLDPFLGSGTTLMAAKIVGRGGIGIEKNARYMRIARKRIDSIIQTELL